MNHAITVGKLWGVGALVLVMAAGCADRNKNDIPDSPASVPEVSNAMNKVSNEASKAVKSAVPALEKGAKELASEAKKIGDPTMTLRIKAAILDNAALKGTTIDVDTKAKTVWLTGTVKSAAQKRVAGDIAKKNATGYAIKNNLKITGGASPQKKH